MKKRMRLYRCNLCFKVVKRMSDKQWMPSMCMDHESVTTRLYLVNRKRVEEVKAND